MSGLKHTTLTSSKQLLRSTTAARVHQSLRFTHPQRRSISLEALDAQKGGRERVLILGSGWGGYGLSRQLDTRYYQPVVISPRGYFIFTPLLASTAVGTLEVRCAMEGVRGNKGGLSGRLWGGGKEKGDGGMEFYQGWCDGVDFQRKEVVVEGAVERERWAAPRNLLPKKPGSNTTTGTTPAEQRTPEQGQKSIIPTGELFRVKYDKLVIAVGCYSQTFNIPGVKEHAFFLKDVSDARNIRRRILECFERASLPTTTPEQRSSLLHFAIVGGGPTGIEFSAELHDLINDDLALLYPSLIPHVRITIYDVAPRILSMFDEELAKYAERHFARQRIEIKTGHHVLRVEREEAGSLGGGKGAAAAGELVIHTKEEGRVPVGCIVWSTGLAMNPFVTEALSREFYLPPAGPTDNTAATSPWLIKKDPKAGRISVDPYLRVKIRPSLSVSSPSSPETTCFLPDTYALGDCAHVEHHDPNPNSNSSATPLHHDLPATAQVANQQATYLRHVFNKSARLPKAQSPSSSSSALSSAPPLPPFTFHNLGIMAYLGSWKAVSQFDSSNKTKTYGKRGNWDIRGRLAWVLWRTAYLSMSVSWRNRVLIPVYWVVNWVCGRDMNRF